MNVTLHAVDNSIHHFNDTIKNNFIDPLVAVRNATKKLYSNAELSDELCRFALTYFSSNPAGAVMYNILPDDDTRVTYLKDVFDLQHLSTMVICDGDVGN